MFADDAVRALARHDVDAIEELAHRDDGWSADVRAVILFLVDRLHRTDAQSRERQATIERFVGGSQVSQERALAAAGGEP